MERVAGSDAADVGLPADPSVDVAHPGAADQELGEASEGDSDER